MKGDVCLTCKLHEKCKSPFMDSNGADKPLVMIIGEAPGEVEDNQGVPFMGTAGELFRNVLTEVGFDLSNIRFTNVVRCRPPDNKISITMINNCKRFAVDDINTYDPKLVILAGNSALQGILGENGIKDWSGNIIEREGRMYVPVYHPAYILRNRSAMDEWLDSLLKACDASNDIFEEDMRKIENIIPHTLQEVLEMQEYLAEYEKIAYDVETPTLDPYSKTDSLLAVSFAAGDKAYSIPLYHPETYWKKSDLDKIVGVVKKILDDHDGKLMGHNIKFDLLHTYTQLGKLYKASDDTMLISSLIDSAPGKHRLKRLSATYLGWYDHESEMDEYAVEHPEADAKNGGSYAYMPLRILLPYSAKDSGAVLLLRDLLYEKLTDKQCVLYDELVMEVSNFLTEVEINGLVVDRYVAQRYKAIYEMRAQELYEEVLCDKLVKRMTKDMQLVKKKWKFNPRSSAHMVMYVYVYGKMKPTKYTKSTKKKVPSTKADVIENYEDKLPLLKKIHYYKILKDALSKYLNSALTSKWISDDGLVHTNFKLNGASTGRIASEHPNIQNIPTEEKAPGTLLEYLPVKNIFTTRQSNGILLSLDESAMELRVCASVANCVPMLDAFRKGLDIHTAVASKVTGIPYEKMDKDTRYYYKRVNWTILYAGTPHTLHARYKIPLAKAEELYDGYLEEFPEIGYYIDDAIKFAQLNGYSESPFGRRRHYTYIKAADDSPQKAADERASVNMPIQSPASDILLASAVIIRKEFDKRDIPIDKVMFINTVHDSIVLDCDKEYVEVVANLCKEVMENIWHWASIYMPGIDFSWLTCPLKADADVGSHYGNKIKLEKYLEGVSK